jgi:hypothetical protein
MRGLEHGIGPDTLFSLGFNSAPEYNLASWEQHWLKIVELRNQGMPVPAEPAF